MTCEDLPGADAPNVAFGALDAPNATLGALDAPNATLGRIGRSSGVVPLRELNLGELESLASDQEA
ncbi:hypothetical protein [Amycolatopsis eburnea]|uniref:Uncharacterized protein n=1 Tax=Amycolatopsis eburnea TaxID=2267691 RepID=A0A427T258_9PSEU|nr:hypothetical protein [Amycolatopsis eburnea]RSD12021.1 hypothetical protein EIY87_35415 [Amycolatopsis eburnea]